jgi:hypothetical protein
MVEEAAKVVANKLLIYMFLELEGNQQIAKHCMHGRNNKVIIEVGS